MLHVGQPRKKFLQIVPEAKGVRKVSHCQHFLLSCFIMKIHQGSQAGRCLDVVVLARCSILWELARSNRQVSNPSLTARSSSIFTDDGCQLVRPRGVRSRIASSRLQIA